MENIRNWIKKSQFGKIITGLTAYSFVITSALGGGLPQSSLKLEVQQVQKAWQHASPLFEKKGAEGFLSSFRDEIKGASQDRIDAATWGFVMKELEKLESLPSISSTESSTETAFTVQHHQMPDLNVELSEDEKVFVNGQLLTLSGAFKTDLNRIYSLYRSHADLRDLKTESYVSWIFELFIPRAYAESDVAGHGEAVDAGSDDSFKFSVPEAPRSESSRPEKKKKKLSTTQKVLIGLGVALVAGLAIYLLTKKDDKKKSQEKLPDGALSSKDSEKFFNEMNWTRSDTTGPNAKVTKQIHDLNVEHSNRMTYNADSLADWPSQGGETVGVMNIATQRADGSWEGGKFDHVRADTKIRDFKNLCGYQSVCPSSGDKVRFWMTSYDGQQSSNVRETTWP